MNQDHVSCKTFFFLLLIEFHLNMLSEMRQKDALFQQLVRPSCYENNMFEKIDLTFDGLTILLTGYNQLIRKKQKPSLYSHVFLGMTAFPWSGVGECSGRVGLQSLGDSTQSDPIYFLFFCSLLLIWWMGNATFLSQQFLLLFFSPPFPSLKSKFITRAWILKDSLSLPSAQEQLGQLSWESD